MATIVKQLIESVKEYPILYDCSHEDFKNFKQRDKVWDQIGLKLEQDESFQQAPPSSFNQFPNENYHPSPESKENQYTDLNTVGANSRLESICDHLLLNNRYNYAGYEESNSFTPLSTDEATQDCTERPESHPTDAGDAATSSVDKSKESDENFGEIIMKSMVETVSA